jgi:hypothetical protein
MEKFYRAKIKKKSDFKAKISIVEEPAIEFRALMLNTDEVIDESESVDIVKLQKIDEERKILSGPAIIPNKWIERKIRRANGEVEEFYIIFTEEDIIDFYEQWKKDGFLINHDHGDRLSKAVVETAFIISDENPTPDFYEYKLEKGSLYVETKYPDDEWKEIKEKGKNAYSIEGAFDAILLKFDNDIIINLSVEEEDDDDINFYLDLLNTNNITINGLLKLADELKICLGCPPNGDGKTKSGEPDKRCSDGSKSKTPADKKPKKEEPKKPEPKKEEPKKTEPPKSPKEVKTEASRRFKERSFEEPVSAEDIKNTGSYDDFDKGKLVDFTNRLYEEQRDKKIKSIWRSMDNVTKPDKEFGYGNNEFDLTWDFETGKPLKAPKGKKRGFKTLGFDRQDRQIIQIDWVNK